MLKHLNTDHNCTIISSEFMCIITIMAERNLTKEHSIFPYYLVKYFIDDKLQVRKQSFVKTNEKILIPSEHEVQWSQKSVDGARAQILATGTDEEMKELERVKLAERKTSKTKSKPKCAPVPPKPKTTKPKTTTLVKKKKATILKRVTPPRFYSSDDEDVTTADNHDEITTTEITAIPRVDTVIPRDNTTDDRANTTDDIQRANNAIREYNTIFRPTIQDDTTIIDETDITIHQDNTAIHQDDTAIHQDHAAIRRNDTAIRRDDNAIRQDETPTRFLHTRPTTPMTPNSHNISNMTLMNNMNTLIQIVTKQEKTIEKLSKRQEASNRQIGDLTHNVGKLTNEVNTLVLQLTQHNQQTLTTQQQHIQNVDENTIPTLKDIPVHCRLSEHELNTIHGEANNAGHFAAKITQRLFPELFGTDQKRLTQNWHGNGPSDKSEMDATKKQAVKLYTNYYYPESRSQTAWNAIVLKINEKLRRKVKKTPKKRHDDNARQDAAIRRDDNNILRDDNNIRRDDNNIRQDDNRRDSNIRRNNNIRRDDNPRDIRRDDAAQNYMYDDNNGATYLMFD